jgi:predicted methyltransferase
LQALRSGVNMRREKEITMHGTGCWNVGCSLRASACKAGTIAILAVSLLGFGCADAPSVPEARIAVKEATSQGASPKVNQAFYAPDFPLWKNRFEGESRELYRKRTEIVAASGARPGMTIADVGAGTGLFTMLFARQVLPHGSVIAVEISRPFAEAILRRAGEEHLQNVSTVIGTHTGSNLPAGVVDIVFTADTYHHFEHTRPILGSLHHALKPGGHLIVVDFERIPGFTPQRTLDHVRAGKETVIREVTSAGFRLRDELKSLGLKDNYYLVFERM